MADIQGVPAELLVRLFYKNSAAGVPGVVPDDGSGDGNVFMFVGNDVQTSQFAATFNNVAAITGAAFNRPAYQNVSGATATITDCNLTGAKEFGGQFINGFTNGHDDSGNVITLDIASPNGDDSCLRWGAASETTTEWTMIELVGWRDCNDNELSVNANIARAITAADPQAGPKFGGTNPADNNFSATLTMQTNSGWGSGPADLFPIFESDGTTATRTPTSIGFEMDTASVYEDLIALCSCDSALRGVPLTAALITANTALDTPLIVGPAV